MWRITRRLRGQFSKSEENRGREAWLPLLLVPSLVVLWARTSCMNWTDLWACGLQRLPEMWTSTWRWLRCGRLTSIKRCHSRLHISGNFCNAQVCMPLHAAAMKGETRSIHSFSPFQLSPPPNELIEIVGLIALKLLEYRRLPQLSRGEPRGGPRWCSNEHQSYTMV